jgi:hypothetical protein
MYDSSGNQWPLSRRSHVYEVHSLVLAHGECALRAFSDMADGCIMSIGICLRREGKHTTQRLIFPPKVRAW